MEIYDYSTIKPALSGNIAWYFSTRGHIFPCGLNINNGDSNSKIDTLVCYLKLRTGIGSSHNIDTAIHKPRRTKSQLGSKQ